VLCVTSLSRGKEFRNKVPYSRDCRQLEVYPETCVSDELTCVADEDESETVSEVLDICTIDSRPKTQETGAKSVMMLCMSRIEV
jgi:hypothetical protein